jgi:hypothetical protein
VAFFLSTDTVVSLAARLPVRDAVERPNGPRHADSDGCWKARVTRAMSPLSCNRLVHARPFPWALKRASGAIKSL